MPTLVLASCLALTAQAATFTAPEKAIIEKIKTLRAVPDSQRGEVTRQLAIDIRNLPPDPAKVTLANALANLSTEGDFGHDTLQQVATTLAESLQQQPSGEKEPYLELAQLVRYEHVDVALDSPQYKSAVAALDSIDQDRAKANFTLIDLSGKSWTLKDLQNHIVLVNFWATWCPPCRKEMPDLDALYQRYKDQGLIVLAISDEDSAKVQAFLAKHPVSYPILLDPGRQVNERFHVDGIPKSFVYDREGHLAAQSIDMRTRGQFLKMLAQAGLSAAANPKTPVSELHLQ